MAIATIDPDGAGFHVEWAKVGAAATKWESVNDDNDTTYISVGNQDESESCTFAALEAVVGTIVSVKTRARAQKTGDFTYRSFARLSGADGAFTAEQAIVGGWAWYISAAIPRPGGGFWTKTDVDSAELCVDSGLTGTAGTVHVAELEGYIDYRPVTGGWSCLVSSFLGPVLGAGLLLSQMPDLIQACNRAAQGKHLIHGSEAAQLYDDLQANKHRRYLI